METFKDRLLKFLKIHAKMGQTKFEEHVGLIRSQISKIKDGMNTISVEKIALKYPELNLNWLLTGKGEMLINNTSTKAPKETPIAGTQLEISFGKIADSNVTLADTNAKLLEINEKITNELMYLYRENANLRKQIIELQSFQKNTAAGA